MNKVLLQSVDKELFRDIISAVGVLKGQVELVGCRQHAEALIAIATGTTEGATSTIYVNLEHISPR